jgi:hypothetical protein
VGILRLSDGLRKALRERLAIRLILMPERNGGGYMSSTRGDLFFSESGVTMFRGLTPSPEAKILTLLGRLVVGRLVQTSK